MSEETKKQRPEDVFEFEAQQKFLTENVAGFAKIAEAFSSGTTTADKVPGARVGMIVLDSSSKVYLITEVDADGKLTGKELGGQASEAA